MVGKICTVCRRYSYNDKHLSYFTYPSDPLRRHKWLIAVGRLDLMAKISNPKTRYNYRICEAHFENKYVQRSKINEGRKFLSKDAFPTLCLNRSNMIKPREKDLTPHTVSNTRNAMWRERQDSNEEEANLKQGSSSRYNLRPMKRVYYEDLIFEAYMEDERPPSCSYEDLSQFCESMMKITQSTQTRVTNFANTENNKINLEALHKVKRARSEEPEYNTFLQLCSKFLSPSLFKLVKLTLNTAGNKRQANFALFALNLYYSSNLYDFLRDMLSLPTRENLKYFLLPKTTRMDTHLMNALRCKINNMSSRERICSFSVGSILLKPTLYYDIRFDRIIGLHDINGIQNISLARYAVLVMVQGMVENWRQPVAYAYISEYDNSPEIAMWIDEVLSTLIEIGLDIRAFVSDPRSEFLYSSESRFVTAEKSYFTMGGTNIFYIYDSSQMLKIVKNNLISCNFVYGSNSKSISNVKFFKKMNNLCNVLNAKIRCSHTRHKGAFSNIKYQMYFLNHMVQLFQNLKVLRKVDGVDVTENMKFIEGFQITINSVLQLFEEFNFLGHKYLYTSRLNHNCLKKFFAQLKQNGGKDECTPRQFNKGFVRSFVFNLLKKPVSSTIVKSSLDAEEFCHQLLDDEFNESSNESVYNQALLVHTTDYRENLPDKNAFVYICGYCYLKCIEIHRCDTFQIFLDGFQRKQENDELTYLCSVSLDLNVPNCHLLPPDEFTEFLMLLESKFKEYLSGHFQIRSIGQEIMEEFEQYGFGMPCPCFPIDYLKALFIRIRLFYTIRKNNKLLKKRKGVKSMKIFSL